MANSPPGVPALDRVEAILRNPEIYKLAALIPQPSREKGGRGRDFPDFMYLVFEALISVYADQRVRQRPPGRGGAFPQGRLEADAPDGQEDVPG